MNQGEIVIYQAIPLLKIANTPRQRHCEGGTTEAICSSIRQIINELFIFY